MREVRGSSRACFRVEPLCEKSMRYSSGGARREKVRKNEVYFEKAGWMDHPRSLLTRRPISLADRRVKPVRLHE